MSDVTFDGILDSQINKVKKYQLATKIIKYKDVLSKELRELDALTYSASSNIVYLKTSLQEIKANNEECMELSKMLKIFDQQILHMEKNIPEKIKEYVKTALPSDSEKENTPEVENVESKAKTACSNKHQDKKKIDTPGNIKSIKKTLFNGPDIFQMPLLTEAEFQKIPKYIIGRYNLDTLNGFVNSINQIIKNKYSIMALGQQGARKKGELDLYLMYKKEQLSLGPEETHTYFFMAEDYEKYINAKLDKTKLNFITALRHCKRMREIRTAKTVHYALIQ